MRACRRHAGEGQRTSAASVASLLFSISWASGPKKASSCWSFSCHELQPSFFVPHWWPGPCRSCDNRRQHCLLFRKLPETDNSSMPLSIGTRSLFRYGRSCGSNQRWAGSFQLFRKGWWSYNHPISSYLRSSYFPTTCHMDWGSQAIARKTARA